MVCFNDFYTERQASHVNDAATLLTVGDASNHGSLFPPLGNLGHKDTVHHITIGGKIVNNKLEHRIE